MTSKGMEEGTGASSDGDEERPDNVKESGF